LLRCCAEDFEEWGSFLHPVPGRQHRTYLAPRSRSDTDLNSSPWRSKEPRNLESGFCAARRQCAGYLYGGDDVEISDWRYDVGTVCNVFELCRYILMPEGAGGRVASEVSREGISHSTIPLVEHHLYNPVLRGGIFNIRTHSK